MNKSFIEQSKLHWHPNGVRNATNEEIQTGCMQRIATATEAMAKGHIELQSEYDYMKKSRAYWIAKAGALQRSNAALKGQITKLKKKLRPVEIPTVLKNFP